MRNLDLYMLISARMGEYGKLPSCLRLARCYSRSLGFYLCFCLPGTWVKKLETF